jgi:hypothetical protein
MVRPGPIEGVDTEPPPDTPGFVSRQQNFLQDRGLAGDAAPTQQELARQRLALLAEMHRRLDPPTEEPSS